MLTLLKFPLAFIGLLTMSSTPDGDDSGPGTSGDGNGEPDGTPDTQPDGDGASSEPDTTTDQIDETVGRVDGVEETQESQPDGGGSEEAEERAPDGDGVEDGVPEGDGRASDEGPAGGAEQEPNGDEAGG